MKYLFAIIVLSLFFCSSPTLKGQMVTYSGPVTFTLEVYKNASGGGSDDGYDWNVSVNEKRLINATFFVTFTGGVSGMSGLSAFKLTGVEEGIDAACEKALAAGARRALKLKVGGAFHSPLMQPAHDELAAAINKAQFSTPICPVYQNVDAMPHTDPEEIK